MEKTKSGKKVAFFIAAMVLAAMFFLLPLGDIKGESLRINEVFPDEGLAQVVASQLGKKTTDTVSDDELNSVFFIDGSKKNIESVIGLGKLTKLEGLDLSDNQLTDVSPEIRELKNLRSLNLSGNGIVSVPVWFSDLPLEEINLSGNGLKSLPGGLSKSHQIRILDVSNNEMINLPSDMEKWTELVRLDLSGNKFLALPDIFSGMAKLEFLDLSENRIFELPGTAGNLVGLKELDLSGNSFKVFPEVLMKMENLEVLKIGSNQLTRLSEGFFLPKLTHLDLSGNPLESVPEEVKNIKSLISLDISKLNLSTSPEWLKDMEQLKVLYINNNKLTESFPLVPDLETYDNRGQVGNTGGSTILEYETAFELSDFVTPILLELMELNEGSLSGQGGWRIILPDEERITISGEDTGEVLETLKKEPGKYTLVFFVDNKNKQRLDGSSYTMHVDVKTDNVNIKGQITDNNSNGVDGASVKAINSEGQVTHQTLTNELGYYNFSWKLPEGEYVIRVEKSQFPKKEQPVILEKGEFLNVNVILGKEDNNQNRVPSTGGVSGGVYVLGAGILLVGGFLWIQKRKEV